MSMIYCGIIKIRFGSIFVVFVGYPRPRIYILDKKFFERIENRRIHEIHMYVGKINNANFSRALNIVIAERFL